MNQAKLLAKAFTAGATDLQRRAPLLDQINVFPVVDADTGVNMSQTIAAGVSCLENGSNDDLVTLCNRLCEPLLKGARGNSGVIFSQFLIGFLGALGQDGTLSHRTFAAAVARGRDAAYASVAEPAEGTILTVMSDLRDILDRIGEINSLDAHLRLEQRLSEAVVRTPEMMPRLKEAGVVDAGALGFHIFASGMSLVLPALTDLEPILAKIDDRITGIDHAPLGGIAQTIEPGFLEAALKDPGEYRYCINMLIELTDTPPARWTASFKKLGSSVDAVQSGRLVKLHLHSNDVPAVLQAGERMGRLIEHSEEDMTSGLVESSDKADKLPTGSSEICVIGDSSMSLAYDIAVKEGIERLENYVHVHNRMVRDSDLNREELFRRMRDKYVYKTAQASPEDVKLFLENMLVTSGHLVYPAVGRAYTGTQELVRKLAESPAFKGRVTVLDTHAASGQQGLICLAAARYARRITDQLEIVHYINKQIVTCREYLVIDNMKYLSRTGRIGKIKAALAGAFSVKPIVGHGQDGAITYAKTRSHQAAIKEIGQRVADHPGAGKLLAMIEYTDNRRWTDHVRDHLKTVLPPDTEIISSPLSSTSAVHMGPGTWGVAVTRT